MKRDPAFEQSHFYFPDSIPAHRERVEAEFDSYYATFDPHTGPLLEKLEQMADAAGDVSSYELKTRMYELLCRECPVHLFLYSDFFFEMSSGRGRYTWGGLQSPVGCFFHNKTAPLWLTPYADELDQDRQDGYLHNWDNPVGIDHHCPGYDKLLSVGVGGIIREAEAKAAACEDPRKAEFYRCVIRANRALLLLASRFADEADRLAGEADGQELRAHFERIAAAARRVPENPPETFYEGLCTVLFYRECVGSLEGIGFSTFGQLDRMLYPLYRADLAAGRITRDEALRLFCDLLSYTNTRFDVNRCYRETSTTIELGGCDRAGEIVCNELTEMILDAAANVRNVGVKLNCRISFRHPQAYLEKMSALLLSGLPTFVMHNDDTLIPARIRQGQEEADARMYVGGGCHEIVLQGTEVCTRADTWISVPRILMGTMEKSAEWPDFESFYRSFIDDVHAYHEKIAAAKNRYEAKWCEYDPLVLYSSSLTGCLDKGMDLTEGGAKYNSTALSMLAPATAIDSLYAVKALVFDEKSLTMAEFNRILGENFANDPELRHHILKDLPKHGTGDPEMDAFSARVLGDLAQVSGQTNGRGGKYLPAFYPHDIFIPLGERTGATPDGRLASVPLSRGVSTSEFIKTDSPLDLIHSLKSIDFTAFADSFCTELTLPDFADKAQGVNVLTAIIRAFLEVGGSSLQFNILDPSLLRKAQEDPDNHKNLLVRVCGYSASFVYLDRSHQDELIARAVR